MSDGLAELLDGKTVPGLYRWLIPGTTRRSEIGDAAMEAGWRLYWLAGQTVIDKQEFLDLCAESFDFPDWFGDNWDALADCLTDLTWAESEAGYLVVYAGWQALAQEEPETFATAVEIFREACDLWHDTETPMSVLFPVTDTSDSPELGLPLLGDA
jgi:RNAse (barnase) inhibitor barstar